jgi:hypothetical protein
MPAYLYDRNVGDDEYIARVRRHAPSSLLPVIAEAGAQYWVPGSWLDGDYRKLTPWALADIARVSLVSGNEHRKPATRRDLLECAAAYSALVELRSGQDPVVSFLLRKASEQFVYNESRYHNLLRTAAIFDQTTPTQELTTLQSGWFEDLFGCSLSQYVGVGFIVHAVAVQHGGRFSEAWLDDPQLEPITSKIPVSVARTVIENHLAGGISHYQQERSNFRPSPVRRYTFNPLLDRPIVAGITDEHLVPVPGLIERKNSPLGIWYAGIDKWHNAFAKEVGHLFEEYVGRHLNLITDATLVPEITYDKDHKRSVDWIVVTDDLVLLVEVKSARPTEPIRLGSNEAWDDLVTKFVKAFEQIEKANQKIEEGNTAFSRIPRDRPRIGLIITMERFPFANWPEIRRRLNISPSIATCVGSSEELELLVTLKDQEPLQFLWDFLNDPGKRGFDLEAELRNLGQEAFRTNAVMDAAWTSYDWGLPAFDAEAAD